MTAPVSAGPVPTGDLDAPRPKQRRGFAAMSPEKQREIASLGGRAAHAKGTAHEWTPEEAKAAGSRGGIAATGKRKPKRKENKP